MKKNRANQSEENIDVSTDGLRRIDSSETKGNKSESVRVDRGSNESRRCEAVILKKSTNGCIFKKGKIL